MLAEGETCKKRNHFEKVLKKRNRKASRFDNVKIEFLPYGGGKPLNILGVCDVTIESKSAIQCHHLHIIKGTHRSLIGFNTTQELGLVNIVNKINTEWEEEYLGLTKGIGKLKNVQVKLHIDQSVRPVAITNWKILFHMRPNIGEEEQRLLSEDTIE